MTVQPLAGMAEIGPNETIVTICLVVAAIVIAVIIIALVVITIIMIIVPCGYTSNLGSLG